MSRAPWAESHTPVSDQGLNVAAALLELLERHRTQRLKLDGLHVREIEAWQRQYGGWLEDQVRRMERSQRQPTPITDRIEARKRQREAATGVGPEAA